MHSDGSCQSLRRQLALSLIVMEVLEMLIHLTRVAFIAFALAIWKPALADISILVREEAGFDRMELTAPLLVMQDAPPVTLDPGVFAVSYVGDILNIFFLDDFLGGLPFGIAAYRAGYTPAPASDPNSIAFLPIVEDFPQGTILPVHIPPVPEPAAFTIIASFLLGGALFRILRRARRMN
jgi:hypothetical protein